VFPPHRRHQTSLTVDWIAGFLYPFFNLGTFAYQSHRRCKSKLFFFFFFYFSPLSLNKRLLFLLSFFPLLPSFPLKEGSKNMLPPPKKKKRTREKKKREQIQTPTLSLLPMSESKTPINKVYPKDQGTETQIRGANRNDFHILTNEKTKGDALVWLSKFMQQRAKKTRLLAPFKSIDPI